MDPIDIILLTHDRLDYLVQTVEALHERTPESFRLTIVDNASGPPVRNWLAANAHMFARVIRRPTNEHVPAFQHGIEATTSDPFVVSDPDLVVPQLEPSWLARLHALMEANPDFGLIGLDFDLPARLGGGPAHPVDPKSLIGGEIREGNVGTCFQMIRREALRDPYVKDSAACNSVRAAGYRVGSATGIRPVHLGAADALEFPAHLASKNDFVADAVDRGALSPYPYYVAAADRSGRPPTFEELAIAAPILQATRGAGVPDASVLELTWASEPILGAAAPEVRSVRANSTVRLPLVRAAAGAVVALEPPPSLVDAVLADAFAIAAACVVLVSDLVTVEARSADELAPKHWRGREQQGIGRLQLELARAGDRLPLATHQRYAALEERGEWLDFFAHGAFGDADRRLFVFTAHVPRPLPLQVRGIEGLAPARPQPRQFDSSPPPSLRRRIRTRLAARVPVRARAVLRRLRGDRPTQR